MLKIINLNLILFSLAIAYGILKIINSYNDKKMEYSVGSEESLPEQISLADIVDKLAEWRPFDELNTEKVKTEYENDFLKTHSDTDLIDVFIEKLKMKRVRMVR